METFRDALYPYWLKRWIALPLDWNEGPYLVNGRKVTVRFVNNNNRELSFQTTIPVIQSDEEEERVVIEFARMTLASGMWLPLYQDTIVPGIVVLQPAQHALIYPMFEFNVFESRKATDKMFGISNVKSKAPKGFTMHWSLAGRVAPEALLEHTLTTMLPLLRFDGIELARGVQSAGSQEELMLESNFLFSHRYENGVSISAQILLTTLEPYDHVADTLRRQLIASDVEEYNLWIKVDNPYLRAEWENAYEQAYDEHVEGLVENFLPLQVAQQIDNLYSRIVMDFQPEREDYVPTLGKWQVTKRVTANDDFYPELERTLTDNEVYMLRDMIEKQRILRLRHMGRIECQLCPSGIAEFAVQHGSQHGTLLCARCADRGVQEI
jgi:hypothetical protein